MTLSVIFYPYHFVRAIVSIPFCPISFCPCTILSIPFCPYHFVRYNLQINANKTKEMIIFRRRSKSVTYPPEPLIPGAERVTALRVLGVVLSSRLTMGDH